MENKQSEMSYIESTIAHVSQENHIQGIHIWLDENEAGDGIALSTNDNFNQDYARMVKILGDVLEFFQTKLEEEKKSEVKPPQVFPITTNVTPVNQVPVNQPAFVVQSNMTNFNPTIQTTDVNPEFIKFFEEEFAKANLPNMDYYEFRQLLIKTQQRMAQKGITSNEVILQTVLGTFEAQGVTIETLIQNANFYKKLIQEKGLAFVNDGNKEKEKQLQVRAEASKHNEQKIFNLQQQIQQLDVQRAKLIEEHQKENSQMELNQNLGQEAIEKIERACQAIKVAENFMLDSIDKDIKLLQTN